MSDKGDWEAKRREVLARTGWTCSYCGEADGPLHIHHRFYESGKKPHEYQNHTLDPLCPKCHAKADGVRRKLVRATGDITAGDALQAMGYMHALALVDGSRKAIHVIDSYEYAQGVGDAIGRTAEWVFAISKDEPITEESLRRFGWFAEWRWSRTPIAAGAL